MGCHLRASCATWIEELEACSECCHSTGRPDRFQPRIPKMKSPRGLCPRCGDRTENGELCEDCRLDDALLHLE